MVIKNADVDFLSFCLSNKDLQQAYYEAISHSEPWNMVSYQWGILGRERGPTTPRDTGPPLAPMPPPCHLGAAARCRGQSSSACCQGMGENGRFWSETEALSHPGVKKGGTIRRPNEARQMDRKKQTKMNNDELEENRQWRNNRDLHFQHMLRSLSAPFCSW